MATALVKEKTMDFVGLQLDATQLKLGSTTYSSADIISGSGGGSPVFTNIDAGASGTAGTVDIFPTTAAKGKIALVAADSTGDTTTTITNAAQSAAATMTIPDTNGSASFVMTAAAQTIGGAKTFSSDITLGAGTTVNLDSATATLVSHATTLTKYAAVITTEALTTAGAASQAFTITLTGVAAGDLAFVTDVGGTNTVRNYTYTAATTTNTITVTVYNNTAATALNGTLKFNLLVLKA